MTSISRNVYIDKLDGIVDECNNTYHSTIKIKPIDVKFSTYIVFAFKNNDKDPKFKVGYHVRISKYKNIFAKVCVPGQKKFFVIKKVKCTVTSTCIISDLNGEEIAGTFFEKELEKTNQKEFKVEKVIKRKSDKLCGKCKDYANYFSCWIDKKYILI